MSWGAVRRDLAIRIFARDEATEDSDIDVVVKFDGSPSARSYFGAQFYTEDLFGRSVDLARRHELRKEILPHVDRDDQCLKSKGRIVSGVHLSRT